jgi:hypothetical protein
MRSSNLWQGVVGFWSASAGPSGYRLLDRSGRGNHGTLTNMDAATDWVIDSGRYALDFDFVNDYVSLGTSWIPLATGSPFTYAVWVNVNSFATTRYCNVGAFRSLTGTFAFYVSNEVFYLGLLMGSNNANWGRWKNDVASSTFLNTWRLCVYTYNGGGATTATNFTTYVDGVQYSVNASLGFGPQFSENAIGYDGGFSATYMSGRISESILFNRAISGEEARLLYQIGRGGMLTPRRRRRAYSVATGLRRRLLLTGQV